MEKKLKELFNVIMEEMKTNDEFKKKIEVVLGGEDKPKKKVKKKVIIEPKLNPLELISKSEVDLREKLSELEVIDLKNIIKFYEMDNTNSSSRWRKKERLVNYIVDVSKSRISRGNAFREWIKKHLHIISIFCIVKIYQ